MITQIRGNLLAKNPPELVVDVNGVGYLIEASMHTFYLLPEIGHPVSLFTQFIVREDAQLLFGFVDSKERELFRQLIKVNGVGPRLALTILSNMSVDEFVQVILQGESTRLVRIPGIGKKTAERLTIEMRDRLKNFDSSTATPFDKLFTMTENEDSGKIIEREAISALIALGYKPHEASRAIAKVDCDKLTLEEAIRHALKVATQ